jgi:hypothetical protein
VVSVDAILSAIYAANDDLIADLETSALLPLTRRTLDALHAALPKAGAAYPPEVAADLDLYLTVARRLLDGDRVRPTVAGTDELARSLVAQALEAKRLARVELFGRPRLVDFTQHAPRGHYASAPLDAYFREAAMNLLPSRRSR